jgi:hypothetical protein
MDLEQLKQIKRIEAPDYLFSKIQQRIELEKSNRMPIQTSYAIAAALLLLIACNAFVLYTNYRANTINKLANAFEVDNNIYLYENE